MYVGKDPARHQLSGIFGGSDMVGQFINECAIDLCALMDKYTAIFKYVFPFIICHPSLMSAGVLGTVMAQPLV